MLAFSQSLNSVPVTNNHNPHIVPKPYLHHHNFLNLRVTATSSSNSPPPLSPSTARFSARRRESISVHQLQKPLSEYMSLPISYYSVLDGEKVEKLDDNTFRCHVYRFNVFAYQICPVLLVRVDKQPNGCQINLLSCTLEGSPSVAAQSDNFDSVDFFGSCGIDLSATEALLFGLLFHTWSHSMRSSMVNQISCDTIPSDSSVQLLTSDTVIEVSMKLPSTFFTIPVKTIEAAGTKVLEQVLRIMLPRFMTQLVKDYTAWALEDDSMEGNTLE